MLKIKNMHIVDIVGDANIYPVAPGAGGTVPSWQSTGSLSGFVSDYRVTVNTAYAIATNSSTTFGTWTNATNVAVAVLRPTGQLTSLTPVTGNNPKRAWGAGLSSSASHAAIGPFAPPSAYGGGINGNDKAVYMLGTFNNITVGEMSGWTNAASTTYTTVRWSSITADSWTVPTATFSSQSSFAGAAFHVASWDP